MTIMTKLLAGAAGAAALATAVPASAQYPYAYAQPYAYGQYNGYNSYSPYNRGYSAYGMNTQAAAQQCTAAVQNRLYSRQGLSSVITSLFGLSGTSARVLSVTEVRPARSSVRVRGLATSGRYAGGYYGAAGYTPDLSFRCDVDFNGYVRNVDINRR
jgi:hypothetical protein